MFIEDIYENVIPIRRYYGVVKTFDLTGAPARGCNSLYMLHGRDVLVGTFVGPLAGMSVGTSVGTNVLGVIRPVVVVDHPTG